MSEVFEVVGALCLIAFCFIVWPPLALLPTGLALLVAGFALDDIGWNRNKP